MDRLTNSFFDEISKYEDGGLRDYQVHHKHVIYNLWKVSDSILLQMPTGTGKTRLFVSMINDFKRYQELNKIKINVLIVTHRIELVEQIKNELYRNYGIKSTLITANNKESHYKPLPVCVASIQTLQRRLERHWNSYPFNFLIIDEAHHTKATTYKKIVSAYSYAKLLGVTATPYRLNGEGFTQEYQKLVVSPSVKKFIEAGWLSNYDYYSIKDDNDIYKGLENIPLDKYGEYATKPLWDYLKKDRIRAEVVGSYLKYAKGKKGIVYTVNKDHSKQLCKEFNECGVVAYNIDSDTNSAERQEIVERFRNGLIDIICNVDIFTEGFDCPDVEVIQLARPTKSLGLYLQQVGRGLRIAYGKRRVLFLDNVGLHNRFGFPSSKRMWRKHFLGLETSELNRFVSMDTDEPFELKRHYEIEEGCEEITLIESTGINELIEKSKVAYQIDSVKTLKNIIDSIFSTNQRVYRELIQDYSEEHLLFESALIEDLVVPCSTIKIICDDEDYLNNKLKNEFKPIVKRGSIVYVSYQDIYEYIKEKEKMLIDRFKGELSKAREQDFFELSRYTVEQLKKYFEDNYGVDHIMTRKFALFCDNHLEKLRWPDIISQWDSINEVKHKEIVLEGVVDDSMPIPDFNRIDSTPEIRICKANLTYKLGDKVRLHGGGLGTIIDVGDTNSMIIVKCGSHITKVFMSEDLQMIEDGLWEPKKDKNEKIKEVIPEYKKDTIIDTKRKKAKVGDKIRIKYNGKEALVTEEYINSGLSWIQIRYSDTNKTQEIINSPKNYKIIN